ncbi:alpha-hydroxy acid oxidase [Variovorax robiniae]|uniref:Alpha-hydroxy acid oxidase n=1 Tax=Variovorax robiniae TaxID=1836199 RepID=A0ABU8XJM7_9BURK
MTIAQTLDRAASIEDLRLIASRKLPRMVFDYIDGASGSEATARRNRSAFDAFHLRQEILVDLSRRNVETTLFGERVALPMVIGPTGMNGAYWVQGDLCLARAAKAESIPFVMSTAATVGLAPLVEAAGPLRWFQLYMLRDRGLARALLERVHGAGFKVLQLTGDTAVVGRRNRDVRNGFTLPFRWSMRKLFDTARRPRWAWQMLREGSPTLRLFAEVVGDVPTGATISEVMQHQINDAFTWHDLEWLRSAWPGQLVLKGVASREHARMALEAGVNGIVVSNHGGRQLDGAGSTIEALPEVVEAVAGRMTILIDSGFRHGADIAKAIALGADAVQLGRPTLYGLAAGGEAGVRHALGILATEFDCAMALAGATTVAELRGRASAAM